METFQIDGITIGKDQPTFIIAEIGINHNGSFERAKQLIDVAAQASVHAVKFQKRHLPDLYCEDVLAHPDKYEQNFQYMIPLLKQVELTQDEMSDLKAYCEEKGLVFLCTPFDINSADFLFQMGVHAFKIASADLTNLVLIEHVMGFGRPLLISTGMSYWEEIDKTVRLLRSKAIDFALLHCRSSYPVWPREVNLKMINRLKQYNCPVGYSGHDIGITIPLIAASMGACIIEKHITLDKKMKGPDHKISLEPHELKRMVRDIRVADQAMGKHSRFLLRGEILNRELFGKSMIAAQEIPADTIISRQMILVKGPGKGLSPSRMDDLIGKKIKRNIARGDYFTEEDVDGPLVIDRHNSFQSKWGLICRFSDFQTMIAFQPKTIEFHLAEKDLEFEVELKESYPQELIVHAPEYMGEQLFDLCSSDPQIQAKSIDVALKTIELAKRLSPNFVGIPKVIVHPGAMSLVEKLEKVPLKQALLNCVKKLSDNSIELLLENLPPYPWYFGGQWKGNYFLDDRDIAEFCELTGLFICFDISHAALYCNAKNKSLTAFIKNVMPYIHHIHFADAYGLDGEGVQLGEGDICLDDVLPLFAQYRHSWTPEIWRGHLHQGKGFMQALDVLHRYLC